MKGISLPISAIIAIALGLLVLVVMSAVFIRGGGTFARSTTSQSQYQECQALCSQMKTWAMNLPTDQVNNSCNDTNNLLKSFTSKCIEQKILTNCTVTTWDGDTCPIVKNGNDYCFICE